MIVCQDIRFSYPGESFDLSFQSLRIGKGEQVALVGPSGCGKTTLLNLMAGVLTPDSGRVEIDGVVVSELGLKERQAFRLEKIGMVPQNFELLDYLNVRDNILTPIHLSPLGNVDPAASDRVMELATRSGIEPLLDKYPGQLSQGERQRVALCRGLINAPKMVLADEPTGNLDPENQDRIVGLLLEEARRLEAPVLMITHEPGLLPRFDRTVALMELRQGGEE